MILESGAVLALGFFYINCTMSIQIPCYESLHHAYSLFQVIFTQFKVRKKATIRSL